MIGLYITVGLSMMMMMMTMIIIIIIIIAYKNEDLTPRAILYAVLKLMLK